MSLLPFSTESKINWGIFFSPGRLWFIRQYLEGAKVLFIQSGHLCFPPGGFGVYVSLVQLCHCFSSCSLYFFNVNKRESYPHSWRKGTKESLSFIKKTISLLPKVYFIDLLFNMSAVYTLYVCMLAQRCRIASLYAFSSKPLCVIIAPSTYSVAVGNPNTSHYTNGVMKVSAFLLPPFIILLTFPTVLPLLIPLSLTSFLSVWPP